jgi:hypothetical protein
MLAQNLLVSEAAAFYPLQTCIFSAPHAFFLHRVCVFFGTSRFFLHRNCFQRRKWSRNMSTFWNLTTGI